MVLAPADDDYRALANASAPSDNAVKGEAVEEDFMRISAFLAAGAALVWTGAAAAQNTSAEVAPVIDVHMHAMEDAS
ncbi:MAG: hypothetical protein VW891_12940, partial [Novosphingobium sp.]